MCCEDTVRTSIFNVKYQGWFAKCGIHPFDKNAIDQKLLPSLQSSISSADDSATVYPSSTDTSSGYPAWMISRFPV